VQPRLRAIRERGFADEVQVRIGIFEQEVAANLAWSVEPPEIARFDTDDSAGTAPGARSVMFSAPGIYKLQARSAFPLPVLSNVVTIKVV
jgi:hypothetical protein